MPEKEAYVEKYKAQIDQWEAEIERLKSKAAEASADTKIEYEKQIQDLQTKTAEQRRKLDELSQAGEGAWEELKIGFENAWGQLQTAWENAKAKFS